MKRISAIILALVLTVFAVGCEKAPPAGTATTTAITTAPMTTVTESAEAATTTATTADTTEAAETTTTIAATRRSTTTELPKSTTTTVAVKTTTAATTTVTTTVRTTVTTTTTAAVDEAQIGEYMTMLINRERAAVGVAPVIFRGDLQAYADIRAAEIKQMFSHTRPNGTTCFTVFEDAGLRFSAMGENIAYGQRTVAEVMEAWMNSEGHRENILSPHFNGVAVGFDDYNWVQLFVYE